MFLSKTDRTDNYSDSIVQARKEKSTQESDILDDAYDDNNTGEVEETSTN